ncbi:MAG: putative dehydrogenase [Lentimonas sp.]|jgi:predicted dehydrogenase
MNTEQSRRDFLKKSIAAGALLGFPSIIPASVLGKNGAIAPSNRAAIGVIGCGSRSGSCSGYVNYPKSDILAVCDPFAGRRAKKAKIWGASHQYSDFRELLARDDIDAVHVVTPDHWHVPISLAAARAGKDVYCEKPLGISIEQDIAAREIVEQHKRVFQYGTQQRSMDACRMGLEIVLNGHIGDVQEVYVWAPGGRHGPTPVEKPVPEGFAYDMWLGPAAEMPYSDERVAPAGGWFIYDYSIGFIGGWGAHPLDMLQWWADEKNLGIPVEYKTEGTLPLHGMYNTLLNWSMEATYANGLKLQFQDTTWAADASKSVVPAAMRFCAEKNPNGTLFVGSKGWICVSRGAITASSEELRRKAKDPGPIRLPVSRNHFGNFADCVLNREQPIASLDSGIRSDIISHMGDIGVRTGETLGWDPIKETIVGSADAVQMMRRPMRAPWPL